MLPVFRSGAEVRATYGADADDMGDLAFVAVRSQMVAEMLQMPHRSPEIRAAMDALNATRSAEGLTPEVRSAFPLTFGAAADPTSPRNTDTVTTRTAPDTETPAAPEAPAFDPRQAPEARSVEVRHGRPLPEGRTFSDLSEARFDGDQAEGLGEYVGGLLTGTWTDRAAELNQEARAQSSGVPAQGGHLIPTPLASGTIDLALAKARTVEAGAQTVPMDSATLKVATVETIPEPQWREESTSIASGALTFGARTFTAHGLAVLVKAPWELLDDAQGFGTVLQAALADAFALELDRVGLYGSGVAPEPGGLIVNSGVVKTPLGANGGPITWEAIAAEVAAIQGDNFDPSALILAPRTEAALSMTKATDGHYVAPPAYVGAIPRMVTNQVPLDLTQGTAENASDVFVGDFTRLSYGIRSAFSILPLRERFADTGEVGFIGFLRADVQVLRPKAFRVVRGVKPA